MKSFPVHIKNILVPHAGTILGDKALSYAIKIAKFSGATVNILHSVESLPPPMFTKKHDSQVQRELGQIEKALSRDIKEELQKRVDYCKSKSVNANQIVTKGRPEDAIIKYSKDHHIDLIIMAKRRKVPGIMGMLGLGSVSRKVLEISDKPILVLE